MRAILLSNRVKLCARLNHPQGLFLNRRNRFLHLNDVSHRLASIFYGTRITRISRISTDVWFYPFDIWHLTFLFNALFII
jgi:hypothetical protein